MTAEQLLWMIPVFPLAAFLVNGLLGRRLTRGGAHWPALAAVGLSLACSLLVLRRAVEEPAWTATVYSWIRVGGFDVPLRLAADSLTAIMLVVVTTVSLLVHWYSIGYMHGDGGYPRFYAYLSLFTFSMLMLVLSANFLLLYVFWEGVGLCSYLLIGFWFHKKSAADAGKKAFLVNRVGDFGFALGILLLIVHAGGVDYAQVFAAAPRIAESAPATLTLICLLLFVGATGKSAQLPLHVWLPDAMEGPTPVSALIHAATMVTAGVYMVARCHALFSLSPTAMQVVAVVGTLTAIMAAAIAFTQTDLKRIMAYSTVSQLGYMFLGLGVGAYAAAIFHLFTHAFFKALLFLGSGSVMHAIGGDCDITKQGRLFGRIRWTAVTFIAGSLSLAGFPFLFSGFYSKEAILGAAWEGGHTWLFAAAMLAAGGTAFYVFRAVISVFFGPKEAEALAASAEAHGGSHGGGHDGHGGHGAGVHESPAVMLVPLVILAVLSLGYGWWADDITGFLNRTFEPAAQAAAGHGGGAGVEAAAEHAGAGEAHGGGHGSPVVLVLSALMVALGIGGAWAVYQKRWIDPERAARALGPLYRLSYRKFYFDEIYDALVVRPLLAIARGSLRFDLGVIDALVNGAGAFAQAGGAAFARLQSGKVRDYLLWMSLGLAVVAGVWLWWQGGYHG